MEAITGFKNNPIPSGKRSDNKAIIVLLGLTGAGKTSTLNFLFDGKNMISDSGSATSKIMEYNAKIRFDENDYDFKIFDTPGFGDTRQKPQVRDARFVATFDDLLRKHEDLKSCYPTTVLLVAKFNDDRIDGETSHFIQMLKAVDTMLANWRLIDKTSENTNLVIVLTHTMSEDNEKLRADPRPKIQLIECLVRTFTKIPTPIHVVMAENKPEEKNLPKVNDFYKLPSGHYYPSNLFKKIQTMATKANDVVGETIVREAFKNPKNIKIELTNEYELLSENNLVTINVLKKLQSARFNIENTQISSEIRRRWDQLDDVSKKPYVNSLQITQSTFHRHRILGEDDIPQSVEAVLKLLMDLPLNPPICSILDGMGVVGPELPKSLSVGNFYNLFADCPLLNSPFSSDAFEYTSIGFRAPKGVEAQAVTESLVLTSSFDNSTQYYQDRLKQLNVIDDFRIENFHSETKEGYNIIPPKTRVTKLTGVSEKRVFQVYMRQPTLSASYRVAINNLPQKFDTKDAEKWREFFTANGTHVIASCYAGGGIFVTANKKENSDTKIETSPQVVLEVIANIFKNVGSFCPMDLNSIAGDWEFKISFRGGNPSLVHPTIKNIFMPVGVKFFKAWSDSITAHPALLHSEIDLECVTHYLRKTNETAFKEINTALAHLYFRTPPPSSKTDEVRGHENVPKTGSTGFSNQANYINKPSSISSRSGRDIGHGNIGNRYQVTPPIINVKGQTWGDWFKQKIKKK